MILQKGVTDHFILVACNVGRLVRFAETEDRRNVDSRFRFPDILSDETTNVFGEGNAKLGRLCMSAPLHVRVHRDLRSCIHGVAIMPSPQTDGNAAVKSV